jgi:hypothetical protein
MHSRKSFSFLAGECHASLEIILEFYSKFKKKKTSGGNPRLFSFVQNTHNESTWFTLQINQLGCNVRLHRHILQLIFWR